MGKPIKMTVTLAALFVVNGVISSHTVASPIFDRNTALALKRALLDRQR